MGSDWKWVLNMYRRLQHSLSFYSHGVIFSTRGYDATALFLLKCTLLCMCVGLTPCFKYSQDDRHSIYLDVYCFELLGMGNAWVGIHVRKRPIWTSSSGENTRMTWLTHTGFEWFLSERVMSMRRSNSNVSSETQKWDLFVSLNILH